jgi:hypothetical protein
MLVPVARLLAKAALWVRIQTCLKTTKWATYAKEWPTHSSPTKNQGFGSGSGLDPYSIGPVDPDPDPYSESGSGSRRAKMSHKSRKNSFFEVLDGLVCELQASSVTWTYFMEA